MSTLSEELKKLLLGAIGDPASTLELISAVESGGGGSGTVTSVALTVPSFLSIGGSPITTNGTLSITLSGTALPILNGGTGQTSANNALNALIPSQSTFSGKFLTTDGTNTSWAAAGSLPAPLEALASYTSDAEGLGSFVGNVSNSDQTNLLVMFGSTDTAIAGNSTSNVAIVAGDNTSAGATGNAGSINLQAGIINNGTGTPGGVQINAGAGDSQPGGTIAFQGGNSNSSTGGGLNFITGQGSARGRIRFNDGTQGTAGQVWTSTDTGGHGAWAAGGNVFGGASLVTPGAIPYVASADTLTQDSANLFYDSVNKRVGIDTNVPVVNLHVVSAGATGIDHGVVQEQNSTNSVNATFGFRKSRGTFSVPTAILSGDNIGQLNGLGFGATTYGTGASVAIRFAATENFSDTTRGCEIDFTTTKNTTSTAHTAARLTNDSQFQLFDSAGSKSVTVATSTGTTSYSLVWPLAQGAASTILSNDGSGNLSWGSGASGTFSTVDSKTVTVVNGIITSIV